LPNKPTKKGKHIMRIHSTSESERSAYTLPDIEIFQLTAREYAESDSNEELIWEYMRRPEFRLASMNSRTREAMFDSMIEEESIEGGWFWWTCLPGCLPDSSAFGPFKTKEDAVRDAVDNSANE
jgi:hypothetical protein